MDTKSGWRSEAHIVSHYGQSAWDQIEGINQLVKDPLGTALVVMIPLEHVVTILDLVGNGSRADPCPYPECPAYGHRRETREE